MKEMAVTTFTAAMAEHDPARQPGGSLARATDRWIYVAMAAGFIVIALLGFIPDSLDKIAAVTSGERPSFPPILHIHAVLMGSFLMLLLAQTILAATGRVQYHRQLGILGAVFVPAILLTGIILVPTMYGETLSAAQNAPAEMREKFQQVVLIKDDILLLQLRMGVLFPLFMVIALFARKTDSGLHKRMTILAIAMLLPAATDRISWLPTTFPASPVGTDFYTVLAVMPMLLRDAIRTRSIDKAYIVWLAINLPFAVAVHGLWNTEWWHSVAPRLLMAG